MPELSNNDIVPSSGDMAVIGETSPNRTLVSLQVLQSIFHELTGKSEEMSKGFSELFKMEFSNLEQLHHRILQWCEQYHVKDETFTAKIFYANDTGDTFTSFNKFCTFRSNSSSSVESVLLTYNFLILLPKVNTPQNYSVTIRFASRVAIENKIYSEINHIPRIILQMGKDVLGVVSVKYIDYVVGRSILNVVEEWMRTVEKSYVSKSIIFVQKYSHFVPDVFKYALAFIGFFSVIHTIPFLLRINPTFEKFAYFLLIAFSGLFFLYQIGLKLGRATERAIDNWGKISYLKFTTGDKEEISKAESRNKKVLVRSIINSLITIVMGVFTGVCTHFVTSWIMNH